MRRNLVILAIAGALCSSARADFYLVVHAANPQAAITQKEAIDLFMGRRHAYRNGDPVLVYDLAGDHPRRDDFYKALTGLSMAQVNSYWSRLTFSGESRPPQQLASEAALLEAVRRQPGALGWVTHEPTEKDGRTVLILKDPN